MSLCNQLLVLHNLSIAEYPSSSVSYNKHDFPHRSTLSTVHRWSHFFFLGRSNDRVLRPAVYFWGRGNDEMQAQKATLVGGNAGTDPSLGTG